MTILPQGPPQSAFDAHGIELRGIERVPPSERTDVHIMGNLTMWLSADLVISTVALGGLAIPLFHLDFWGAVLLIVLVNIVAVLPVAFFSTLGPKLGLRQMTITRFSFGWVGTMVVSALNVAACIGWSAVNVIVGGQLVEALSGGRVPCPLGIVLIAALTTLVSIYGYRWVHRYERFAWIPMLIVFAMVARAGLPQARIPPPLLDFANPAALLSFGAAVYGFATGWTPYAADYNVNQPQDVSSRRVFWLTFIGVYAPCVLLELLGLALTTIPSCAGLTGGTLLAASVAPLGTAAEVVLLVMALSVIANNIPNDYSLGLSMQVFGRRFQRVPRHIWTFVGAVIYVALAIPAASAFAETLTDFLLVIGYWLAPYAVILALEHFVFRHGSYVVEDWDNPARLPAGWAAVGALALGLVGAGLGAAQALYVGPVARLFGPAGADVGIELAVVLSAVGYLLLRPLEKRFTQR